MSAAAFAAAAARASVTRFDSDCSIHSSFPASLFVQMKTFGGYFSVAFSVTQPDDAGAVGVGVGVALGEADSLARGVVIEAAD
ncbi:hypothetical protein [Arthrobacter sp. ISL-72]|uniref:hypothetical protein n=1 Tax=Arthrobacter sp. ISL-72 TaxID=2819114 RepID=UPI001BEB8D84|nr:hypothetical protein [Arthrobacter sp. ISL-72]MBT2596226.1 hypothetical protein [Arthrobacter sp. ISL-72]